MKSNNSGKKEIILSPKKKKFADKYIETNNATQAVKDVFETKKKKYTEKYVRVKAHRLITSDNIQEYIKGIASGAVCRIEELSKKAKNEMVKLNANKDIVDRALGKATQLIGTDKEHPLEINITSDEKQTINKTLARYMGNTKEQRK